MKVEVQPIYVRGKAVRAQDRKAMPKYHGMLKVHEERVGDLARIVTTAALVSAVDGSQPPVLPSLHDASLLYLKGSEMRISGFELIEGAQYGQTWDVRVKGC